MKLYIYTCPNAKEKGYSSDGVDDRSAYDERDNKGTEIIQKIMIRDDKVEVDGSGKINKEKYVNFKFSGFQ